MRSAPYGNIRAQEGLEAVLMASAFEQSLSLVLVDDGVQQLLAHQAPDAIGTKNFSSAYKALEMYGVERVVVDSTALTERGLGIDDLLLPAQLADRCEIARLLDEADLVMAF